MNSSEKRLSKSKNRDYRFKLVLLGCYGVGKTSIMLQHFDRQFSDETQITVGVDFRQRKFHIDNCSVILEVWDTAGEEKYANIVQVYYRGAHAVVTVYDIRNKASYERALEYYEDIVNQAIPPSVIALVGNKSDLSEYKAISTDDAHAFASKHNILFLETSAKTSDNIDQLFETIARKLIEETREKENLKMEKRQLRINEKQKRNERQKCCY